MTVEQKARELLAREFEDENNPGAAREIRDEDLPLICDSGADVALIALRAIVAALTLPDEERIRREAFEEAARLIDARINYCAGAMELPGLSHEDRRIWEQRRNEARGSARAIRALTSSPTGGENE